MTDEIAGPFETWLAGLGLTDIFTGAWAIEHAEVLYAKAREQDRLLQGRDAEIVLLRIGLEDVQTAAAQGLNDKQTIRHMVSIARAALAEKEA